MNEAMSKTRERTISVRVDDPEWRSVIADLPKLCDDIAAAVSDTIGAPLDQIAVSFCNDEAIRGLNATFRGYDKPTNVLSFPAGPAPDVPGQSAFLGDIAVARETVIAEARDQEKDVRDHTAHLVVHGVLHLLGYDHETAQDAPAMEAQERAILRSLGIADPYIVTAKEPT